MHLVTTLNVGGLERVVLDLVRHHDPQLVVPGVACLDQAGDLQSAFEQAGVSPSSLNIVRSSLPTRVWRLASFLRKWKPDVLHTHNSAPHVLGALAAKLAGVPVLVHTKHGRNYVDRPKAVLGNRIASRLSSCVVPVSRDAADVARTIERVPDRLLTVIHNGIDLTLYGKPARNAVENRRIGKAIHVARLNRVKDQATLLSAAKLVVEAQPEFTLDIIGDGPARAEVEQLRLELGLERNVNLLGMRSDVPELLKNADFFVLSSISEGISLTLLEAMASELAIVATDVGGNSEVVEPEVTGVLVPARNAEALGGAMLRLANDVSLCRSWGVAGRTRVEADFDVARASRAYLSLYVDLLSSTARYKRRRKHGIQSPDDMATVQGFRLGRE